MSVKRTTVSTVPPRIWDVVVIGGGPAGMMAAATAAKRGRQVLLLEKNHSLGKKLLITGGGRCNVTNNTPDIRTMAAKYNSVSQFLFSAFSQHAVAESIDWFTSRAVPLIEENEGRLFPSTQTAQSVWNALVTELHVTGVVVESRRIVTAILVEPDGSFAIHLQDGVNVRATSCVVATGGTSRPETGATGDGFRFLAELGHTIVQNSYALVPITVRDTWVPKVSGLTLPTTKVTLYVDDIKHSSHTGKLLFTHVGLSGPLILNQSKLIGELLTSGTVTLKLDLLSTHDAGKLKKIFAELLRDESNKKIKNVLSNLIPGSLVEPLLMLAHVDSETPCHSVRTNDRTTILQLLKALPLTVSGLLGSDKAIVSSGGVTPNDIEFKTMESRRVPRLFVVGDVLNIDRPSGGYSLQLCWTTGFVAGSHV